MSGTKEKDREAAIRALIAVRAYEMWENQGRPRGLEAVHWRQAEQDVMSSLAEGRTLGSRLKTQPITAASKTR